MKNPFSIAGQGKPNPVPTSKSRFTGVFLPQPIHAYLSLFALYEKIPKSNILRNEIEEWYERAKKTHHVDTMINSIINLAQEEWESRKRINKNVWKGNLSYAFDDYKKEIKNTLKKKGLSKVHTETIILGLKA
jgi:hypothetical protein